MTSYEVIEMIRAALRRFWWLSMLALPLVLAACNKGSAPGY
ncbi:MAG: hypothetical protein P4L30_07490 [Candidatus Limnocylindrales bacterium]|jgi:hypothetical protein|nr:hypothetical protein [Candidatus Limnocylindrales bacterium]